MGEPSRRRAGGQKESNHLMLSRTLHSSVVGRSASIRRQRRRSASSSRLYCGTNGCASFLTIDPERKLAICEVCGFTRRLS